MICNTQSIDLINPFRWPASGNGSFTNHTAQATCRSAFDMQLELVRSFELAKKLNYLSINVNEKYLPRSETTGSTAEPR
jgi:hypothetical protein